jgi:hypothetical protein
VCDHPHDFGCCMACPGGYVLFPQPCANRQYVHRTCHHEKGYHNNGRIFLQDEESCQQHMVAAIQPLSNKEFVAYVLNGLDEEIYNALVSSIVMRVEPISASELFSQMISYELHMDKQSGGSYSLLSSANAATRTGSRRPLELCWEQQFRVRTRSISWHWSRVLFWSSTRQWSHEQQLPSHIRFFY